MARHPRTCPAGIKRYLTLISPLLALPLVAQEGNTQIYYSSINSVSVTTEESAIAQNAIIGGFVGTAIGAAMGGTSGAARGLLMGAAEGAAFTALFEGDRRVFLYTITDVEGRSIEFATERGGVVEGECVAIEQNGKHNNLRMVSTVHCERPWDPSIADEEIESHRLAVAEQCRMAKDAVHAARSDAEIDIMLRKMRALCE